MKDAGIKNVIRKIGATINLITLFWVWGYVLTLLFVAIGIVCRCAARCAGVVGNSKNVSNHRQ